MPLTENHLLPPEPAERDADAAPPGDDRLSPEEWYDLIVQASADGSWFYDIENNAIHYSASFLDILDFQTDKDYFTPEEFMDHVHPDDRNRYKRTLGRHLRGGPAFSRPRYGCSTRRATCAGY